MPYKNIDIMRTTKYAPWSRDYLGQGVLIQKSDLIQKSEDVCAEVERARKGEAELLLNVEGKVNNEDLAYVSVKNFGALGDGFTDDSAAIQEALDYSNDNLVTIYFPKGKYVVRNTLFIGEFCSIRGGNQLPFGKDPYGPGQNNDVVIQCFALTVFKGKGSVETSLFQTELAIHGIAFQQGDPNDNNMLESIFLYKMQLNRSDIRHSLFRGFGTWLLGTIFMKTYIQRNIFMEMRKVFIQGMDIPGGIGSQATIVDSKIVDNYISGSQEGSTDNIAFRLHYPAFAEIKGNFIDFWKWGFDIWQGEAFSVYDNTFQYCSIGIRTGGAAGQNYYNNRFGKMNYAVHKNDFRQNVDRWGTNWIGIALVYSTKNCVCTNNIGSTVDTLISIRDSEYGGLYVESNMGGDVIIDTNQLDDEAKKIFIQKFR